MAEAWLWPIGLGLLGIIFGSHIATVAIRWPERSAMRGRSHCDACCATVEARDLVPIASYLLLRGRCRSCRSRIAPSHLLIEIIGGAVGIAAGLAVPGWQGAMGAVFGWLLLLLAAIDLARFWLPNRLVALLAIAGAADAALGFGAPVLDRAVGACAGFGALALVAAGYRRLRGRTGLGGGDPKLFGAIGLWLGWRALPLVLLAASVGGLIVVLILRLGGTKLRLHDRLPLGTLLAAAAFPIWCVHAIPEG